MGIIKEAILLLEGATAREIADAVLSRDVVEITYNGNSSTGTRVIEPVSFGINYSNNRVLRAWQRSGNSRSYDSGKSKPNDPLTDVPGYRMFNVSKIGQFRATGEKYRTDKTFLRLNRPKHNKYLGREDADMKTVFASVPVDKNISVEYIFDEVKSMVEKKYRIPSAKANKFRNFSFSDFVKRSVPNLSDFERFTGRKAKVNLMVNILLKVAGVKKK